MQIHLSLAINGTGFEFGVATATEAKRDLAEKLRMIADRVEHSNADVTSVNLRDDVTDEVFGQLMLNIRQGTSP